MGSLTLRDLPLSTQAHRALSPGLLKDLSYAKGQWA
jgi:hypothetical protein